MSVVELVGEGLEWGVVLSDEYVNTATDITACGEDISHAVSAGALAADDKRRPPASKRDHSASKRSTAHIDDAATSDGDSFVGGAQLSSVESTRNPGCGHGKSALTACTPQPVRGRNRGRGEKKLSLVPRGSTHRFFRRLTHSLPLRRAAQVAHYVIR
ncbi:hypothetical protein Aduo_004000 [Ancylostoma duodenale]